MPMSNDLKAKLADSMSLLEKLKAIVAANYEASLPVEVKELVDALPFTIAEARLMGLNYALAMPLREGVDFAELNRVDRFRNKKPKPELLRVRARAVFQYCLDNGLQPELSPYEKGSDGKLSSEITITWEAHLLDNLPTQAVVDGSFLKGLKELHANSTEPKGIIARARFSGALEQLPKILRTIELECMRGATEVMAYAQWITAYQATVTPDLTADLQSFCEVLGLKTRIHMEYGSVSSRGNVSGFVLYVSGWATVDKAVGN